MTVSFYIQCVNNSERTSRGTNTWNSPALKSSSKEVQATIFNFKYYPYHGITSEVTHTIVSVLLLRFLSTCYWHINSLHSMLKLYLKLQFGGMWHNKWKHTSRETFWSYLWSECSMLAIQEATEDADKHLHSNTFVIQTKRSAPSREPGH